jgi:hypothetical protein
VTWYLKIDPQQEPNDGLGLDGSGRVQFSFNVIAQRRPSAPMAFVQELFKILTEAGVGIEGENMFATSKAVIPDGNGPFLSITLTPGLVPVGTHNGGTAAYRRPAAQIVARATSSTVASAMAYAAYEAFLAVRNRAVSA